MTVASLLADLLDDFHICFKLVNPLMSGPETIRKPANPGSGQHDIKTCPGVRAHSDLKLAPGCGLLSTYPSEQKTYLLLTSPTLPHSCTDDVKSMSAFAVAATIFVCV